jgi:hypothetical protein
MSQPAVSISTMGASRSSSATPQTSASERPLTLSSGRKLSQLTRLRPPAPTVVHLDGAPVRDHAPHAVLDLGYGARRAIHLEELDGFGKARVDTVSERHAEPVALRLDADDRRRELLVVTCKDCAAPEAERHPAAEFGGLRALVDNNSVKEVGILCHEFAQRAVGGARAGGEHDLTATEDGSGHTLLAFSQLAPNAPLLSTQLRPLHTRRAADTATEVADFGTHVFDDARALVCLDPAVWRSQRD